jgi:hypothetical protein
LILPHDENLIKCQANRFLFLCFAYLNPSALKWLKGMPRNDMGFFLGRLMFFCFGMKIGGNSFCSPLVELNQNNEILKFLK